MSRFRFVEDHRDVYDVKRLCRLAEVSRSGFHAWRTRPASPRQVADEQLVAQIVTIHVDSRRTYGAPRVHGQLGRRGVRVGCKRVARLMRISGLVGVNPRRKWRRGRPHIAPAPAVTSRWRWAMRSALDSSIRRTPPPRLPHTSAPRITLSSATGPLQFEALVQCSILAVSSVAARR